MHVRYTATYPETAPELARPDDFISGLDESQVKDVLQPLDQQARTTSSGLCAVPLSTCILSSCLSFFCLYLQSYILGVGVFGHVHWSI